MCGIVGYIGKKDALKVVLGGLKRLEYRGYDSAGVAFFDDVSKSIQIIKRQGRISVLESALSRKKSAYIATTIGHTRWATHGSPSDINAHPHFDCRKEIAIAHNGIIENHGIIRDALLREGHKFSSATDTEVISHLIERSLKQGARSFEDAFREALRHLEGTFGIVAVSNKFPNLMLASRRGSPLLLGIGKNEYLVASDASAVREYTKRVIYLDDNEIVSITPQSYRIFDLSNHNRRKTPSIIEWSATDVEKSGYPHFMAKEIHEIPQVVENAIRGRVIAKKGEVKLGGIESLGGRLMNIKRVVLVACGTSYYASLVGKYLMESIAKIPCEVAYGSEFRYRPPIMDKNSLVVAISQSGETADTLEAIREAKRQNALTFGVVNVVGSSIAREVTAGIYNHAGPEIAVASTKAFISQIVILTELALYLGIKHGLSGIEARAMAEDLMRLPHLCRKVLAKENEVRRIARKYADKNNFLYLGRKFNWPTAMEGALKLKEISYIHAEGYPAGEMKHGPIALIDKNFPSIVLAFKDSVYEKIVSNLEEIRARKGPVIAIATEGDTAIAKYSSDMFFIPPIREELSPILAVIPLQLFAYHMAVLRGADVDKPRNLAKSVTVE